MPIGDVGRKSEISQATAYAWRKRRLPGETRRPKALEDASARLKKLVADLSLDQEIASGRTPRVRESP